MSRHRSVDDAECDDGDAGRENALGCCRRIAERVELVARVFGHQQIEIDGCGERGDGNESPDDAPAATGRVGHLGKDRRVALVYAARDEVVPDVVDREEAAHDTHKEQHVLQHIGRGANVECEQPAQQHDEGEVEDAQVVIVRVEDEDQQEEDEHAGRDLRREFVATITKRVHVSIEDCHRSRQGSGCVPGDDQAHAPHSRAEVSLTKPCK